jgi:hypothetical protein
MASKKVVDREEALSLLRHAVDVRMPEAARKMEEVLAPELRDGESVPDAYAQADLLVRRLERSFASLSAADEEVLYQRAVRRTQVGEVREAAADLRAELKEVRRFIRLACGRRAAEVLPGVPAEVPRHSPQALERICKLAIDKLTAPGGLPLDPDRELGGDGPKLAGRLQRHLRRLERARTLKWQSRGRLEAAQVEKDRAMKAFNAAFPETAALIAAYLRLAGDPELADELQPSRQEPGLLHKQVRRRRATRAGRKAKEGDRGEASAL